MTIDGDKVTLTKKELWAIVNETHGMEGYVAKDAIGVMPVDVYMNEYLNQEVIDKWLTFFETGNWDHRKVVKE